jgi:ABC-type transport system substrate-binding protein
MSKTMTKIISLLLVLVMALGVCFVAVGCNVDDDNKTVGQANKDNKNENKNDVTTPEEETQGDEKDDPVTIVTGKNYTYKTATTALGTCWNPHAWDTNADNSMLSYVSSPFVDMSILDSENGVYQWVYEMATSVKDVTKANQADLEKYPVNLPEGKTAADIEEGYVFEIALNKNAAWQNGEKIDADDYIESFKRLLDPKMRNYRANLYYDGESAVAGGAEYYNSEAPVYAPVIFPYGEGEDPVKDENSAGKKIFINPTATNMTIASYSFYAICNDYGFIDGELYKKVAETANAYG